MGDIKKVVWHPEYGDGLYPFCPYCDEYAYEKDKCVFCEKPYEWVESPIKDTIVEVDGYKVVQTSGNHIYIYNKDGILVCHMSCTAKKTEEELLETFKLYEELRKE